VIKALRLRYTACRTGFDSYYRYYLTLHSKAWTRNLHFLGNLATLLFVLYVVLSDLSLWWLLPTPFIVYPFAWFSHDLIEKNEPAAWSNPVLAKLCDWRMMFDMMRGKL
jgi:hypothetical protein